MGRIHALVIAAAVAFSVAAGTFAALRTTRLDSTAGPSISPAAISKQEKALGRAQRRLAAALRQKPPKLPALPAVRTVTPAPAPAPAPAPVAVVVASRHTAVTHTSSSPHAGHGEDDSGSSFDD